MRNTLLLLVFSSLPAISIAQEPADTPTTADEYLARYFAAATQELTEANRMTNIRSADQWLDQQNSLRQQLRSMLGLDPLPPRTPLEMQVTGVIDHDGYTVRKLHFQSMPGLYVTANLYVPKNPPEKLPAVLYVCGHGRVIEDGVSYGNKTYYQHHPNWFARNGYVCLIIDTLQLGEIQGIHHGTYRENMWWWINRGYTPAGVETWNCMRAIDLLQSLPEVDGNRIGITGRSGGGVYSWWAAAVDERIQCAVPVAGITDMTNYVVDGCVEGHCDCMFLVNQFRWDYPQVAALVAPRPLLVSNTDSDTIFPLDGVYRTFEEVRHIYTLLGARDRVALNITAGPHQDTQELRVHAFRWFNEHMKGDKDASVLPTEKPFPPRELKVFDSLPADARNATIHEDFVPIATPALPDDVAAWERMASQWKSRLREDVFGGWPTDSHHGQEFHARTIFDVTTDGLRLRRIDFESQPHVPVSLLIAQTDSTTTDTLQLHVLDNPQWTELLSVLAPAYGHQPGMQSDTRDEQGFVQWARELRKKNSVQAYLAPRGVGPWAWDANPRQQTQIRRRFYLLGQTLDGMRVLDVRQATAFLASEYQSIQLEGDGVMAGIALYASHFSPNVSSLRLKTLPSTHRHGPILLSIRKHMDMPHSLALAATSKQVVVSGSKPNAFAYAQRVAELLGRNDALVFEPVNTENQQIPAP